MKKLSRSGSAPSRQQIRSALVAIDVAFFKADKIEYFTIGKIFLLCMILLGAVSGGRVGASGRNYAHDGTGVGFVFARGYSACRVRSPLELHWR